MIIPRRLKIGGHLVTVVFAKLKGDIAGDADYGTGQIRLHRDLSQSQKEATLIHEIIHILNSTVSSTEMGHIFQDSFAEQLYQVLKQNNLLK